ncbi:MAG: AMP-binding protein [Actinomycetota bacterium]
MPDGLYQRNLETTPWPEVQRAAFEKAKIQLERVYSLSPFYKRKYDEAGVDPTLIAEPADFAKLPFFTKDDERRTQEEDPPYGGHLCVDPGEIVRVHASSGTTGRPTFFALTSADVDTWRTIMARTFYTTGIRKDDVAACLANLSMFVGGIPVIEAYSSIGAAAIPIGATAGTERTIELMQQLGVTVMAITPSFAVYLGELVEQQLGIPASQLGLRLMLVGGEPGGQIPAVRQQIQSVWGCPVRDAMGMGEFAGAMWGESSDEAGMHFCAQDEVYLELIDPDTGALIPFEDGAEGELIYTAVQREAHPLIRFRSHDHVRVQMSPTPSGRTAPRITTLGRTDDMLLVRGINVFPSAVRDVVAGFVPETTGHIQIVLSKPGPLVQPPLRVDVEIANTLPPDSRDDVCRRVAAALRQRLSFTADVRPLDEGTLPRTALKTQYVRVEG